MPKLDHVTQGSFHLAQTEALTRKHPQLTANHLLIGFIKNPKSILSRQLQEYKKMIEGILETLPTVQDIHLDQLGTKSDFNEWYTLAFSRATQAGRDTANEADFIRYLGDFFPQIKIAQIDEDKSTLPDFLVNLNELAEKGKLDPVIGRSQEIRRVQEILCRRTKNNPLLIGPPGVGKTAIVEGLAGLIVSNQVPDIIRGRTVYSMNIGSMMSNTKYRGEFEEKIEALLNFLKQEGREAILFIDEIHLMIGAGKTEGGSMDAANLLKPALSRGEIHCIGATTLGEYKEHIESDAALERRFHQVQIDEPTEEESVQIIMGLKEKLEIHHGIEITDEAVVSAVHLSKKYIADRFLPDKAIDIIDEAAAGMKLSADSIPPEMQELEALIRNKKILAGSETKKNPRLQEEIVALEKKYEEEKNDFDKKNVELKLVSNLKKELENSQFQFQRAEMDGDYEQASRLKYGVIPKLIEKLNAVDVSWKLSRKHIGEVVERNTGIPVSRILSSRLDNMLGLETFLTNRVLGQKESLTEISSCLLSSHAGLTNQNRPLGSFLLLGPSGVGKTETAKAIAEYLFHSGKNLIRIDLSEYREEHSVSKLIGAPPGYIGYEKGGMLTEAVRRKPYSVLLFDEVEKAHINFSDILLQILDEGRLTDAQGRMVNFQNTVICITSNLKNYEDFFKSELIGRFDAILHYNYLNETIIDSLIERELKALNFNLESRQLSVNIDPEIKKSVKKAGFDPKYGARPLINAFNRYVVRPLSKILLQDTDLKGDFFFTRGENEIPYLKPLSTENK